MRLEFFCVCDAVASRYVLILCPDAADKIILATIFSHSPYSYFHLYALFVLVFSLCRFVLPLLLLFAFYDYLTLIASRLQ